MKGDVHVSGHETPFPQRDVIPTDIDMREGQIQVFLTDYVLNSTVRTLYQADLFDTQVDDIPVSELLYVFPDLKNFTGQNMTIIFKMIGEEDKFYDPSIAIVDGDTYLEGIAEISMGVQKDGRYMEIYQIIC